MKDYNYQSSIFYYYVVLKKLPRIVITLQEMFIFIAKLIKVKQVEN